MKILVSIGGASGIIYGIRLLEELNKSGVEVHLVTILVSMGGASGSIYGIRLLEELNKSGVEVHLVTSDGAKKILDHETNYSYDDLLKNANIIYENDDLFAAPASGSFIANGYGNTLTSRAASCCLKEGRKLILVIRETPYDLPSVKNMLSAKQSGAVILPATPGFYHKPKTIDDLVDFVVGKILDQLKIDHSLYERWG